MSARLFTIREVHDEAADSDTAGDFDRGGGAGNYWLSRLAISEPA
jgi:hypothetical protein